MAPFRVDVEFDGNSQLFQGERVKEGRFDSDGIIFSHGEKGRRGVRADAQFRRYFVAVILVRKISRIDQNGEVRAAAQFIGFIHIRISALTVAVAERRREVCARRKAEDTNSIRINPELSRALADQT
jgi:hypothetical protein